MNDMTETIHLDAPPVALSQALRIADIHASPTNPRKTFPEAEQAELIASVQRHGVMQPILVRPWPAAYAYEGDKPLYELIAGERRYRAAKAAGLEFISGTVRDLDDHETLELQIVENLHRKDLNELEEAEGYELMTKQYGYTADQLAEKIGKSKAYIYGRLKLVALSQPAREAFRAGKLTASTALLIARIPGESLQRQAIKGITSTWQGVLSYRAAAQHIQSNYCFYLDKAPFPLEDAELHPTAGTCSVCPKRSGTIPEAFPDIERADVCTDPECYKAKQAAWLQIEKDRAREAGREPIEGEAAKDIDVNNGRKYIALDKVEYSLPGAPTVRDTLKDKAVETILVEDEHSGRLVEMVEKKAFEGVLQAAGIKRDDYRERERELEREARAENRVRSALFQRWHDALQADLVKDETPDLETHELAMVAGKLWSLLTSEDQETMMHLWAPASDAKKSWHRRHEMCAAITQRLPQMARRELVLFLLDCVLASDGRCQIHSIKHTPTRLINCAHDVGVDAEEVRRQVEAEGGKKHAKTPAVKTTKATAPAKTYQVDDYVEVITYCTNPELIGSIGQVASEATAIASGQPVYTLTLADGHSLVAEPKELTASTAEAFAAQQVERNPASNEDDPEPAVVRTKRTADLVAYIHPENADLTWTGRGRKPKWVEVWLEKGGTLEELAPATRCDKTMELPGVTTPELQPAA